MVMVKGLGARVFGLGFLDDVRVGDSSTYDCISCPASAEIVVSAARYTVCYAHTRCAMNDCGVRVSNSQDTGPM